MVLWQLRTFQETTEYLCLLKRALTLIWNYLICSSVVGLFVCLFFAFLPAHPTVSSMRAGTSVCFVHGYISRARYTFVEQMDSTQKVWWEITWGRKGQSLIPLCTWTPSRDWALNVKMKNYHIPRYMPERTEMRCSKSCTTMSIGALFITDKR